MARKRFDLKLAFVELEITAKKIKKVGFQSSFFLQRKVSQVLDLKKQWN